MFAGKAYIGKSKINSAKRLLLLQRGFNLGPPVIHPDVYLTELSIACKTETFRILIKLRSIDFS